MSFLCIFELSCLILMIAMIGNVNYRPFKYVHFLVLFQVQVLYRIRTFPRRDADGNDP